MTGPIAQALATLGYAGLVLALLGLGQGCTPAPKAPCSRQALAELVAECVARIKLTCEPGDETCHAYQDCSKRVADWKACK